MAVGLTLQLRQKDLIGSKGGRRMIGDYVYVRLWEDNSAHIDALAVEKTRNVILYEISGVNFISMLCDEVDAHVINEVNLDANCDNFTRYLLHRGFNHNYYFKRFDRGAEKWVCM